MTIAAATAPALMRMARNSPIVVFAIAFSFGCTARAPRHE